MSLTIPFGTPVVPDVYNIYKGSSDFKETQSLDVRVVLTGQHKEMVEQVNSIFDIRFDNDLKVMTHGQTLNQLTINILKIFMF